MRIVDFSARSLVDIADIVAESKASWGEEQAKRYASELRRRIDSLAERPELGPPAGRGIPNLRRLRVNRHVVYYLPDEERVVIVRILHERMNHSAHLKPRA